MKKRKNIILLFLIIFFIISLYLFLDNVDVQRLVVRIGVHNGYAIVFLVSLFGSLTVVTSTFYFATISTFVIGGLNPIIVAVLSAIALTVGDFFIFLLFYKGIRIIEIYRDNKIRKMFEWFFSKPKIIPLFILLYFAVIPLPNEMMLAILALDKSKYKNIMPAIFIGNLIFSLIISFSIFYTGDIVFLKIK